MHLKIAVLLFLFKQYIHGTLCDETCPGIPQDICPYGISEETGEAVKLIPKYLPRDHPEYDVRTPEEARDKINLYCAHPACYSQPCRNEGTCREELDGYSCSCLEGYQGINCEYACHSQRCLNGGTCSEELDGYTCACPDGYGGINCEYEICPPGWVFGKTKCFLITQRTSDWQGAVSYCQTLSAVTLGNGTMAEPSLLYIESVEEFTLLRPSVSAGSVWENCNDQNVDATYVCVRDRAGNPTSYRDWDGNEPDDPTAHCVSLYMVSGRMHDAWCSSIKATVCQINILP